MSELARRLGVHRQTLYAIEREEVPITVKTWKKLRDLEQAIGSPRGREVVMEAGKVYDSTPSDRRFADYLSFIRGCREEAERLSGGDLEKGIEIFDKLLATWMRDQEVQK